jgi:hypothetical protein
MIVDSWDLVVQLPADAFENSSIKVCSFYPEDIVKKDQESFLSRCGNVEFRKLKTDVLIEVRSATKVSYELTPVKLKL